MLLFAKSNIEYFIIMYRIEASAMIGFGAHLCILFIDLGIDLGLHLCVDLA